MSRISAYVVALLTAIGLAGATQVPVSIVDFAFSPDTVRVNVGDSVVWTNNGAAIHTSTSGANGVWDSLWDSGNLSHGATFVHGFPANGTFSYFCRHHASMKGVVVVGTGGVNETPGSGTTARGIASYPNPFRTAMVIRLGPTRPDSRVLSVFNASGNLVRKLDAGRSASVVWDGRDGRGQETGPGLYFVRYGSVVLAVTRLR